MAYSPTVQGRILAQELRHLRARAEMTAERVASSLDWETSKLSRIENARQRITSGEVMELCEVYAVTGERRDKLIRRAREARKRGWWHPYRDVLKEGFGEYLAFEAEAVKYRGYHVQLIPGLFQTADYARAVFKGSRPRTPEEVERGVEARIARQQRLNSSENPLHVWEIIDEGALRRMVDGPAVMKAQLDHLLSLADLATVSLQVVPHDVGVHPAIDGPFTLLSFDGYPEVMYIEHVMGCLYLEKLGETTQGSVVFEHLRTEGLNAGDSAALIREVAKEFR